MQTLELASDGLPTDTLADATPVESDTATAPTTPRDWPLLVLDPGPLPDAGKFLARCRWCGWTSPRQATPDAAMAAFAAHSCQERPA